MTNITSELQETFKKHVMTPLKVCPSGGQQTGKVGNLLDIV